MDAKLFDEFVRATQVAESKARPPARSPRPAAQGAKPSREAPASATPSEQTAASAQTGMGASALSLGDGDQVSDETQKLDVAVVEELILLWRMRQRWHRAEKSLILQGKAICRGLCGGDKAAGSALFDRAHKGEPVEPVVEWSLAPFRAAIRGFEADRELLEKRLRKLARGLPIWGGWAKDIHGLGELGVAGIVGSACVREGEDGHVTVRMLGDYRSVSALWKRMGLAVIDGKRQRKCVDEDEALLHGYSPSRRSVMWNVGASLIGGMGRGPRPRVGEDMGAREDLSPWQRLFVERLRYLAERDPAEYAREPVTSERTGETMESFSAHAAASAKRYVEKRFLREMWSAWREQDRQTRLAPKPIRPASAAATEACLPVQPKERPPRSRTNSRIGGPACRRKPRSTRPSKATGATTAAQPFRRPPRSPPHPANDRPGSKSNPHLGCLSSPRPRPSETRKPGNNRLGRGPLHQNGRPRPRRNPRYLCLSFASRGPRNPRNPGPRRPGSHPLSELTMTDIGTTPRKPLSPTQRLKLFEAHRGICALCSRTHPRRAMARRASASAWARRWQ